MISHHLYQLCVEYSVKDAGPGYARINGYIVGLGWDGLCRADSAPVLYTRPGAACAQPAATPTHIFRPIGDKQLPCWTQAWEDRPTQVLTVAHGGERSNDTA